MKSLILLLFLLPSFVFSAGLQNNTVGVPAGTVIAFAGSTCPAGYLSADGATISRTTYAKLFAAMGVVSGNGDGSTTFHKPDYRGRFLRGTDGGTARDPNAGSRTAMNAGGNSGSNVGSVQGNATAKNGLVYSFNDPGHAHPYQQSASNSTGSLPFTGSFSAGPPTIGFFSTDLASSLITSTLSNGDAETRPINAYVQYCIKF